MQNGESSLKEQLHLHLQKHKGQTFGYEMVRELISFVSDMERGHQSISWVSKDGLIRLLNSVFKRVGQKLDDDAIAGLEDSILSALVFYESIDTYSSKGAQSGDSGSKDHTAGSPDLKRQEELERIYFRLKQEFILFENRIVQLLEKSAADDKELKERIQKEKKELELKLTAEFSALESSFAHDRSAREDRLEKEYNDLMEAISLLTVKYDEQTNKMETYFKTHMKEMELNSDIIKDNSDRLVTEYSKKSENIIRKSEISFENHAIQMDRKLEQMDRRIDKGRRAIKRMTVLSIIGIAGMIIGFLALYYLK